MRKSTYAVYLFALGLLLASSSRSMAMVNLELRPSTQNAFAGQGVINLELYAVANPAEPVGFVAVVLQWDTSGLTLIGNDDTGSPTWGSSGFFGGGLNASLSDGDAFYTANIGLLGTNPCLTSPPSATPSGLLLTTLQFQSTGMLGTPQVSILATLGGSNTEVYDDLLSLDCGGVLVNGTVTSTASVTINPCTSGMTDCVDGTMCTDDVCTSGVCSNPINYSLSTHCCDPATGATLPLSDGIECTDDFCNSSNGQVTHINTPATVPCGDPAQTDCTNPDTCDGMGVCQDNHGGDGSFCNFPGLCTLGGMCATGVCTGGTPEPNGTLCNDGLNCTQNDTCTAGVCGGANPCTDGNIPFCFEDGQGFVCGNCIDDNNCPPDIGCLDRSCSIISHLCTEIQDSASCDDTFFCNGVESCDPATGGCLPGAGDPCAAQMLTCSEATDTCVACFTDPDCDQSDPCNPEVCFAGQCIAGTPVFCAQDIVNEPCRINTCNPANGQCEFVLPQTVACDSQTPCPCDDDPLGLDCQFLCEDQVTNTCFVAGPCSDGTGCTSNDACEMSTGVCVGDPPITGGTIDLSLEATATPFLPGQTVPVEIFLTLNPGASSVEIISVESTLIWDPIIFGLPITAVDPCDNGVGSFGCGFGATTCPNMSDLGGDPPLCTFNYDWPASGFLSSFDPDGLNLNFADGDAHYEARILPGDNQPGGNGVAVLSTANNSLHVTTINLTAFKATTSAGTQVTMPACVGTLGTRSRVFAGPIGPGGSSDLTDELFDATVFINCSADIHCDDGNPCTTGTCPTNPNPQARFCVYSGVVNGTPCGNGTPTDQCDQADACLAGVCDANPMPNGTGCVDGLFCNINETCQAGVCAGGQQNSCTDSIPCTVDSCDEASDVCSNIPDHVSCDNTLFCDGVEQCDTMLGCVDAPDPDCTSDGIACTENDFCNETLKRCDGIPNNNLCTPPDVCISGTGCGSDCQIPVIEASGTKYIGISPQPEDFTGPMGLLISSPLDWPCLSANPEGGKYVGMPFAAVDLDANGTIDGQIATVVDDPMLKGALTPVQWGGKACNNLSPACTDDIDCPLGEFCVPIKRCTNSLTACTDTLDCAAGETCVLGKVYVSGEAIAPSTSAIVNGALIPSRYDVQAECAALSLPATIQMRRWGDVQPNDFFNGIDIALVVQAFRLEFHLPPGSDPSSTKISADVAGGPVNTFCDPEFSVNGVDVLRLVNTFNGATYSDHAAASCGMPCP